MLAGRPILAPYNGFPFMLEEIGFGWFIKPDDVAALKQKILEIASMPSSELNMMGLKGKSYLYSHLSYEKLASDLNQVLHHFSSLK
jgi:glycosyltransferase involved in cell wall biosynthesis